MEAVGDSVELAAGAVDAASAVYGDYYGAYQIAQTTYTITGSIPASIAASGGHLVVRKLGGYENAVRRSREAANDAYDVVTDTLTDGVLEMKEAVNVLKTVTVQGVELAGDTVSALASINPTQFASRAVCDVMRNIIREDVQINIRSGIEMSPSISTSYEPAFTTTTTDNILQTSFWDVTPEGDSWGVEVSEMKDPPEIPEVEETEEEYDVRRKIEWDEFERKTQEESDLAERNHAEREAFFEKQRLQQEQEEFDSMKANKG